jgi:hypothetical protein
LTGVAVGFFTVLVADFDVEADFVFVAARVVLVEDRRVDVLLELEDAASCQSSKHKIYIQLPGGN